MIRILISRLLFKALKEKLCTWSTTPGERRAKLQKSFTENTITCVETNVANMRDEKTIILKGYTTSKYYIVSDCSEKQNDWSGLNMSGGS